MPEKIKSILKYLLFVGIGGLFMFLAFRSADWKQMLQEFQRADYRYVLASIIMGYLAFISRGYRWALLLRPLGYKVNRWNAVHAVSMGYFVNALVPRAGELARCSALYRTDKVPIDKLFGTVVLERIIDFFFLLGFIVGAFFVQLENIAALFELVNTKPDGRRGMSWLQIGLITIPIVLALVLWIFRRKIQALPFFAKVRELWNGFKEGFRSLAKLENKWAFWAHTAFIWAMYYFMIYIVVFALPATSGLGLGTGLLVMVAGGLGMVVPSPGGIGSYHYFVTKALFVLGINETEGLSFATLVHSGQFLMTIVAGVIAMIALSRFALARKQES